MPFGMTINFNGNCREAVTFYAKVFEQEIPTFLTYGNADTSVDPNFKVSDSMKNMVMYTSLTIEGTNIAFSDMPDTFDFIRGNSMFLTLMYPSTVMAEVIFPKLSKDGQVLAPFAKTSEQGFLGMLVDQFELSWIIQV